ncbi:MAG: hypothetical protein ACOYEC_00540 [Christensenellales bacterium]|jgi:hypothetical protein|nr:hypothetical protein [Clostridiales bacterium]
MKKAFLLVSALTLIIIMSFAFIACGDKDDELTIVRYEIKDYELIEGDKFDVSKVAINCYLSDGSVRDVKNNLYFDKAELEDKLDDENNLSEDSAGEYTVPVYHLDKKIGDLKVIVKVKR